MNKVVTRFAPSPTGFVHLGNIRTAFFSWLYARKMNGKFLIRIDDTDKNRSFAKYTNNILDILNWLKIKSDEEIIFQSKNYEIYKKFLIKLIENKKAYKCYCSKERLNFIKKNQIENKIQIKYDGFCRNKIENKLSDFVVRFSNNIEGFVEFNDDIKGSIKIANSELDDFIIAKNNYFPTYNFASAVDDIIFNISNVIRGEDHISNTPKQIKIIEALGYKIPKFAHLPMILDEEKNLLSKRNENMNMLFYKRNGFLPESILNYILRLGWSYKNKEIFSISEMINLFDIKDVNNSKCIINTKKLIWLNKHYISKSSVKNIMINLIPIEKKFNINYRFGPNIKDLIEFSKNRVDTIKDIITNNLFLYEIDFDLNKIFIDKYFKKNIIDIISDIYFLFKKSTFLWDLNNIKNTINNLIIENKISLSDIAIPLRILITGSEKSMPLYELIFISGRILILRKIINIIKKMGL